MDKTEGEGVTAMIQGASVSGVTRSLVLTQAFVLTFVMAGGDDSVMWLRVKDDDIDAADEEREGP